LTPLSWGYFFGGARRREERWWRAPPRRAWGRGVLSSVTVTELLVGARDRASEARVLDLLGRLPVVAFDRDFSRGAALAAQAATGEPWHGFELDPGSTR